MEVVVGGIGKAASNKGGNMAAGKSGNTTVVKGCGGSSLGMFMFFNSSY